MYFAELILSIVEMVDCEQQSFFFYSLLCTSLSKQKCQVFDSSRFSNVKIAAFLHYWSK